MSDIIYTTNFPLIFGRFNAWNGKGQQILQGKKRLEHMGMLQTLTSLQASGHIRSLLLQSGIL
jgi:hypothetical protein